jgi:single-stranded DNA-binding protein
MTITCFTNNRFELMGRISRMNEFSKDKAMSITLALNNGKDVDGNDKPSSFIPVKSFAPEIYKELKTGMLVIVYGHIKSSTYEKDGKTVYATDLIADNILLLESKAVISAREMAKILG